MQALKIKNRISVAAMIAMLLSSFVFILALPQTASAQVDAVDYCEGRFGSVGPSGIPPENLSGCMTAHGQRVTFCNALSPTGNPSRSECLNGVESYLNATYPPDPGPAGPPGGQQIEERPTCDGAPGVAVSFVTDDGDRCLEFDEETDSLEDNPIFVMLGRVIQFLLASVGIGLTMVIVIAGFQYMTARGDPQKTASAKKKIGFAITGVAMYALSGALLNWLIPGGIIG